MEKILEKQAPAALQQMSEMFATDLATGMALMALLVLFVPPIAQWIFEGSAALARYLELRNKRLSRRDYLAAISSEAIMIARQARAITIHGRWDYEEADVVGLTGEDAWRARERKRSEKSQRQAEDLQIFVTNSLGRANFLMREFVSYGFARDVPYVFEHITNYFCVGELANALEGAAYKVRAALIRDGFPLEEDQSAQLQQLPSTGAETKQKSPLG